MDNSITPNTQDEAALIQYDLDCMEDEIALRAYEEAKKEYDANPVTYSHDEVRQMLDL